MAGATLPCNLPGGHAFLAVSTALLLSDSVSAAWALDIADFSLLPVLSRGARSLGCLIPPFSKTLSQLHFTVLLDGLLPKAMLPIHSPVPQAEVSPSAAQVAPNKGFLTSQHLWAT